MRHQKYAGFNESGQSAEPARLHPPHAMIFACSAAADTSVARCRRIRQPSSRSSAKHANRPSKFRPHSICVQIDHVYAALRTTGLRGPLRAEARMSGYMVATCPSTGGHKRQEWKVKHGSRCSTSALLQVITQQKARWAVQEEIKLQEMRRAR